MIFDLRPFKKPRGSSGRTSRKRLMDFGFHAPTVSFPVAGTLMVEPTESEPKAELDRFCDAMIAIRAEIRGCGRRAGRREDNVLKNARTGRGGGATMAASLLARAGGFSAALGRQNKYWPPVGRIDNPYGDRNLFCSCPPLTSPS